MIRMILMALMAGSAWVKCEKEYCVGVDLVGVEAREEAGLIEEAGEIELGEFSSGVAAEASGRGCMGADEGCKQAGFVLVEWTMEEEELKDLNGLAEEGVKVVVRSQILKKKGSKNVVEALAEELEKEEDEAEEKKEDEEEKKEEEEEKKEEEEEKKEEEEEKKEEEEEKKEEEEEKKEDKEDKDDKDDKDVQDVQDDQDEKEKPQEGGDGQKQGDDEQETDTKVQVVEGEVGEKNEGEKKAEMRKKVVLYCTNTEGRVCKYIEEKLKIEGIPNPFTRDPEPEPEPQPQPEPEPKPTPAPEPTDPEHTDPEQAEAEEKKVDDKGEDEEGDEEGEGKKNGKGKKNEKVFEEDTVYLFAFDGKKGQESGMHVEDVKKVVKKIKEESSEFVAHYVGIEGEMEPIKNGLLMSMGVLQGLIVLLVFLCMMGPVVWLSFSVQSAGDFEEGDAVPAGRSGKQKEN
ncbi:uncharacterized protein MONOS_15195fu5174 [Monocercomonoides exilis]|uniref:uncharacterized protein n=1 Tax=Monocercomonoides exilis TaxID=2049356 RepID=UPI0035599E25|nr:hypothetical protein MONOS_15195fu5174 [Monocercomonoides exilis]